MKKIIIYSLSIFLLSGSILTSCKSIQNANNTQKGAAIGTAAGAVLGAVIGNNVGNGKNSKLGAVLGGVIGGVTGGVIGNKMDKQAREIKEAVPGAEVERVGEGIALTLGENAVRFDTNKSTLTSTAQANLDKLVSVFKNYENTDIVIYGYTDSTGKVEYNQVLSEKRANSVKNYLVSKGLNADRFKTEGFGVNNPIASNDTAEGRSKNRRVEFAIVANEQMIENAKKEAGQ
ncbi:outer membrane protein OmpA-like peptidoglycan-associated protein [Tenacibaculum adriaticum]|uniref:Outer membrane protein OmpA-like peptidoglycan-associated protein n=1 Tax=Tenacibaculum adriaticum TaxID=413713 RepID=A0A5S5DS90_9FLAO|nr:OmpA family protein [Tenacibaculum adriaticum]TYP98751.1 outer membrane protein OmpA-like peptidoglycan-associated protein [Tenacibaculum adriaticum]